MDDLISRAEALMEARPEYLSPEQIGHEEYNKGWSDAISMYWNNLNDLPVKTQGRPTDGDLISRKAAKDITFRSPFFSDALMEELDALPSADRPTDSDLISRAEAIETIEIVDWYHQNSNKDMVHGANDDEHQAWYKADDVYKALEAVPSAVRPRGYWKDGKWCSVCGMPIATDVWGTSVDESEVHYCIECGAEMRGEGE